MAPCNAHEYLVLKCVWEGACVYIVCRCACFVRHIELGCFPDDISIVQYGCFCTSMYSAGERERENKRERGTENKRKRERERERGKV